MENVIVHEYCEPNFRKLQKIEEADCANCRFSEKTMILDGEEGYLCHARLYDLKKLSCYVPK